MASREPPVVGLMPAAGRADRLGALPCSKEIFPVGFRSVDGVRRPRPACHCLLEAFRMGGIDQAWVLLRKGKWDIPTLLGSGQTDGGPNLAYLALDATASVPETLDAAYPFVAECRVALGFPDILFEPEDAYAHLIELHDEGQADVVLGLFPTDRCEKTDMVELEADGKRVRRLVIKKPDRGLRFTWSIAVWGPRFTHYLHEQVQYQNANQRQGNTKELYVGDVIQSAIDDGLVASSVAFPGGSYLDIGTPEDLENALRQGPPV